MIFLYLYILIIVKESSLVFFVGISNTVINLFLVEMMVIIHSPVMLAEVLSFVPEHAKLIVDGTL